MRRVVDSLAVILPAAGRSTRFGADKLLSPLGGKQVLRHSLDVFLARRDVKQIVIPGGRRPEIYRLLANYYHEELEHDRIVPCHGGTCRASSVLKGMMHVPLETQWIAVHDAARPLVTQDLIDRTLHGAVAHGACVPGLPVPLTVRLGADHLPCRAMGVVPRHRLWAMQTPQVAKHTLLIEAFEDPPLPLERVTDDLQLVELCGHDVWVIPGDERNIKITQPWDITIAEAFLRLPNKH